MIAHAMQNIGKNIKQRSHHNCLADLGLIYTYNNANANLNFGAKQPQALGGYFPPKNQI